MILELLGEGGMATVFRARDGGLRRDVAVKVLFPHLARKPEVVSRFHREARAAAALDHPNILRVLDVGGGPPGQSEGGAIDPPYMVLELFEGGSLSDRFGDGEPLLAECVAAIGVILARALGAAHAAGIIHRDIKPANIMAGKGEGARLVIADFGVARVSEEDSVVTRTGALLGTPAYMSPEQAAAEPLDARSDLYSMGATLYRLATGSMPFTGPTAKVVSMILSGNFTPPQRRRPQIGPSLAAVIEKLMATDRDHRFADAASVEVALTAILDDNGVTLDEALDAALGDSDVPKLEQRILAATLDRAEAAAAAGRVPTAISLADRALALEARNPRALAVIDSLAGGGKRWRIVVAAAVLATAALVTLFLAGVFPSRQSTRAALDTFDAAATSAIGADGSAAPEADAETVVAVIPSERSDAGARVRETDRGTDRIDPRESRRDAAPDPRPIDAGARQAVRPDARAPEVVLAVGTVNLKLASFCSLEVDGAALGEVSRKRSIELPPGRHSLVCKNSQAGWQVTRTVNVVSNKSVAIDLDPALRVRVNIADGVEVGGKFVATGSSFETKPKRLGVVVRRGEDRALVYVTVTENCTLEGTPLRCNASR